jgi:hypothetical protein
VKPFIEINDEMVGIGLAFHPKHEVYIALLWWVIGIRWGKG